MLKLEVLSKRSLSEIEINKFKSQIKSLGQKTIIEMARAGPETQAKLLQGLGLKGYMVVDGKNPVNLFNTANGLMGNLLGAGNK
jgi:major vault protein